MMFAWVSIFQNAPKFTACGKEKQKENRHQILDICTMILKIQNLKLDQHIYMFY